MIESDDGLSPREDTATRIAQSTCIALFCDFDGTYSVQDVGSTIARTYLNDRRTELWRRYEQGEFDPWSFNMELFAGFRFPQQKLHEFLATIDLDPGAEALQAYCADNNISFRILSDGFDYNLDWLQGHYGVSFDYAANHLRYGGAAGDEWVIAPGARNDACECGTGVCKRTIIREQRKLRPGAFCVHVGNGRVSDLCGAEEADLAFGKDSLATALLERKHPFEPFDSLNDVVATLGGFVEDAKALRA